MDTWFSDVLSLPMNSHVVVARIAKALSSREKGGGGPAAQGFNATFKDLSFVDLVRALGTGVKNVRMRIEHGSGGRADIYFRPTETAGRGQPPPDRFETAASGLERHGGR